MTLQVQFGAPHQQIAALEAQLRACSAHQEQIAALQSQVTALQAEVQELRARLGRLLRRGRENSDRKAAGLCRELTKWWAVLWTFARIEGIEPINNVSERTLRPAVLWRKGSFGSDNESRSRFAERMLTVVATCRQQGRRLLDFLMAADEAVLQGTAAPSLLPTPQGS